MAANASLGSLPVGLMVFGSCVTSHILRGNACGSALMEAAHRMDSFTPVRS